MTDLQTIHTAVAEHTGVTGPLQIGKNLEKKAVPDTQIYGNDRKTGETAKVLTRTKEYRDEQGNLCYETEMYKKCYSHGKNWAKVWLMDLLMALGMISNSKQMDVVFYVLENVKLSENLFIGTIRGISEKTGISTKTVNIAINKMLEAHIITKIQAGVYMVNPAFILQGSEGKQRKLTISYAEATAEDNEEEDLEAMIEAE